MMTLAPPPLRFTALCVKISQQWWDCDCGATSLAAVLGVTLGDARRILLASGVPVNRINDGEMRKAIEGSGYRCRLHKDLPSHGIAAIEYQPGRYHYIGVCGEKIFDCNTMLLWGAGWWSYRTWRRWLLPRYTKGFSFRIDSGIEIEGRRM
jgi:hypothetical protein